MTTVLPTPAPPKRPILPPFTNGAIRSMTLMPVSKISVLGSRSVNLGVSRWIGQRSVSAGSGGPPSTGSPSTLRIRPRATLPTRAAAAYGALRLPLQRRSAAHDLGDLLGNRSLPLPIIGALQHLQDLTRVVGRVLHRGPPGPMLCGRGLHQAPVHRVADVERQQL